MAGGWTMILHEQATVVIIILTHFIINYDTLISPTTDDQPWPATPVNNTCQSKNVVLLIENLIIVVHF